MIGLELEGIEDKSEQLKPFVVAEILEATKHPNADKLQVCKVKTATGELQIVCGAPNARAGLVAPLAMVGAQLLNLVFVAKRFHDLDRSALYIFGMLVPIYNIYLGIILLFQKGTTGANRFGPDPLARQIAA